MKKFDNLRSRFQPTLVPKNNEKKICKCKDYCILQPGLVVLLTTPVLSNLLKWFIINKCTSFSD